MKENKRKTDVERLKELLKSSEIGHRDKSKHGLFFIGIDRDYCFVGKCSLESVGGTMGFYWNEGDFSREPEITIDFSLNDAEIMKTLVGMENASLWAREKDKAMVRLMEEILAEEKAKRYGFC